MSVEATSRAEMVFCRAGRLRPDVQKIISIGRLPASERAEPWSAARRINVQKWILQGRTLAAGRGSKSKEKERAMNILFFLTPKSEVEFVYEDYTLRQTIEKMEAHRYSEVPVINRDGKYVGTITEGDLLWYIKANSDLNLQEAEHVKLAGIRRKRQTAAVSVSAKVEDLMEKVLNQNFVPVVDDNEIFIGIVKRKDILHYCYQHMS